ncbi:MAG: hypothetical protein ACYS7Y_12025 [Planctomycetota bacterium]|jgi:hypothetical protein
MRRGAADLWNNYHHQKRCIARAYVKGEIPERDETYVLEVVDQADIEAAKHSIPRSEWFTNLRLAQLEMEMETVLATLNQPTWTGRVKVNRPNGLPTQVGGRRVGLVPYKVRVFNDSGGRIPEPCYTVLATRSLDARILAFALDGGYGAYKELTTLKDGHVELAITWTEVITDE